MSNEVIVKVIKAFQPGDTVFIELAHPVSADAIDRIRREFDAIVAPMGINIVVLAHGMRIAAREEVQHSV